MSQVFQTCALNRVDHLGNTFFECGSAKPTFTTLSVVGPDPAQRDDLHQWVIRVSNP